MWLTRVAAWVRGSGSGESKSFDWQQEGASHKRQSLNLASPSASGDEIPRHTKYTLSRPLTLARVRRAFAASAGTRLNRSLLGW